MSGNSAWAPISARVDITAMLANGRSRRVASRSTRLVRAARFSTSALSRSALITSVMTTHTSMVQALLPSRHLPGVGLERVGELVQGGPGALDDETADGDDVGDDGAEEERRAHGANRRRQVVGVERAHRLERRQ
ncbi:MAG: hypothetical protein ACODAC_08945 [Pseudomonadota bacterium]